MTLSSILSEEFKPLHKFEPLALEKETEDNESLFKQFDSSLVSSEELARIEIQAREPFMGTWFRQGDLGYILGLEV